MRECVFRGNEMLINDVNPRLQAAWTKDGRKGYFPFSAATKVWRTEHCPQINPYTSEFCPYGRDECTLAYYQAMIRTLDAHPDNYIAFARTVAKNSGMERADNKPLARDMVNPRRTSGHQEGAGGLRAGLRTGPLDGLAKADGQPVRLGEMEGHARGSVYRPSGFSRVGELLGQDDVRPHLAARGRDEGQASPNDDGDGVLDLRTPPSVDKLGDGTSPRDPDLHQGGE